MIGIFEKSDESFLKAIKLSPLDPELGDLFYTGLSYLKYLGSVSMKKALEAVRKDPATISGKRYG